MKLLKVLGITTALLLSAVIGFGIYTARQAHHYQTVVGSVLERQLGFRHGSPYITIDGENVEVFTLHPQQAGALAAAGVQDGDIVRSHSITGFHRALHEHLGLKISFRVADGGDGLPIPKRPVRIVTLQVPLNNQRMASFDQQ